VSIVLLVVVRDKSGSIGPCSFAPAAANLLAPLVLTI
jgi:hypothetical protein